MSSLFACAMEDPVEEKPSVATDEVEFAPTELGSADSGSEVDELPWCDLVVEELDEWTPYRTWTFEGACDDVFIDLANRGGEDMFLLLYEARGAGWELVDWNDDCYGGTLNACLGLSTDPGVEYGVIGTTFEYLYWGEAASVEAHLRLSCRDEAGECREPASRCGSRGMAPCPEGSYCDFDEFDASNACGARDIPGICVLLPDSCPRVLRPVCGCDGQTYTNECYAAMVAGVDVAHAGECPTTGGIGEACGGIAGFRCAEGLICDYSDLDFSERGVCGADDLGVCVEDEPMACPMVWAPVCGCDGVTYGNDCERRAAHVALAHLGACE